MPKKHNAVVTGKLAVLPSPATLTIELLRNPHPRTKTRTLTGFAYSLGDLTIYNAPVSTDYYHPTPIDRENPFDVGVTISADAGMNADYVFFRWTITPPNVWVMGMTEAFQIPSLPWPDSVTVPPISSLSWPQGAEAGFALELLYSSDGSVAAPAVAGYWLQG